MMWLVVVSRSIFMGKQGHPKYGSAIRVNGREMAKEFVVEDRVRMAMGVLSADERIAVAEVLTSADRMRRVLKRAKLAGSERKFLVADLTTGLRGVFRETGREIRLVELLASVRPKIGSATKSAGFFGESSNEDCRYEFYSRASIWDFHGIEPQSSRRISHAYALQSAATTGLPAHRNGEAELELP